MKFLLFYTVTLLVIHNGFTQNCPIVKVVSPSVAKPTESGIASSTCSTLVVQWKGSAGKSYVISAIRYNPATNTKDTVTGSNATCNASFVCTSTIPVIAGRVITWSVQADSMFTNPPLSSYSVKNVLEYPIPACSQAGNTVTFSGKVMLQGAYNPSAGMMSNDLNTLGILQSQASNQPYNSGSFGYTGTEKAGAGFFAANPDIVDWVLVELRNPNAPATAVARRAAFVKQNGTLVDTNGVNTLISFPNTAPGNYHVVIRHRNHLGIRTTDALDFSSNTANYDFTTGNFKSFKNQPYTSPAQMGTVWLMRGGDANSNAGLRYQGPSNDRATILTTLVNNELSTINGYYTADINMNGQVKYQGPGNDRAFLLSAVLTNVELTVLLQQLQ